MQKTDNVSLRQPFIDFGINLAPKILSTRDDLSKPAIVIINGHEGSAKSLLALAFDAACEGIQTVPGCRNADSYLVSEQGRPVVFANMSRMEMPDTRFIEKMRLFRDGYQDRKFVVLANLRSAQLNALRSHHVSDIPDCIDAHIEVLKTNWRSAFEDSGPERTVIVTTHDATLG